MSLYSSYLTERTYDQIIEHAYGFATYRFLEDRVYIVDIYIRPENRKQGFATKIANEIVDLAKAQGMKKVIGTVCPSAKGSTESLMVLLGYGMRLQSSGQDFIVMEKEI